MFPDWGLPAGVSEPQSLAHIRFIVNILAHFGGFRHFPPNMAGLVVIPLSYKRLSTLRAQNISLAVFFGQIRALNC